jgi:hypothetical protein
MKNIITYSALKILTLIFFIILTNQPVQAQLKFNPLINNLNENQYSNYQITYNDYLTKNPFKLNKNHPLKQQVNNRKIQTLSEYYFSLAWIKESFTVSHPENSNKINKSDFTYAGFKRFTINGELPNLSTQIDPLNAAVTAGIGITLAIALHINQSAAWWDGKGRSFYFKDDWNAALQADKFGHFMGGYFVSYFAREGLVFSGVGWDQSIILGSMIGIVSQAYVEFKDGFADNTGFSYTDFAANVFGVGYFYLQHYIIFLQNFTPKWQYTPPGLIGVPPKARTQTFIDNYNSTTAWFSVHMHNLLPGDNFWPKWLNLAFGYGIDGYYTSQMHRRFVIGLDYNLVELLPDGPSFWNWFKQSLNAVKWPAPAVEFSSQGTKFLLLYPFSIL